MKRCIPAPVSFKLSDKRKCNRLSTNIYNAAFSESDESSIENKVSCINNAIEDTAAISLRLQNEGNTLAENRRYWEALSKFQQAIDLNSDYLSKLDSNKNEYLYEKTSCKKAVLHELSSQCFSELGEIYPAVDAAEKAVQDNSKCPLTWQRLSRAQINIGELYLAKRNIQRSLHMSPTLTDAWEDLDYLRGLIEQLSNKTLTSLPIITRPGIICQRGNL